MFDETYRRVLSEIEFILAGVDEPEIDALVNELLRARTIVLTGAGRAGLAAHGFAMRLGHLGLKAYASGDSTLPGIGDGDLLLIASGSGETQTVFDLAGIAKTDGARVAVITGRRESRIGALADVVVLMKVPTKVEGLDGFESSQPMTTLNEQCLQVLFDIIVLLLMKKTDQTAAAMWQRHSKLE
jgi:6-phospho-3-hexuloisomerase